MFWGLHIEVATLKTVGDLLKRSGWVQALVQAEIATAGTPDSFFYAARYSYRNGPTSDSCCSIYLEAPCLCQLQSIMLKRWTSGVGFQGMVLSERTSLPTVPILFNCYGVGALCTDLCTFTAFSILPNVYISMP